MRKQNMGFQPWRKLTALLLALIMTMGSLPSIIFANNSIHNDFDFNYGIDDNILVALNESQMSLDLDFAEFESEYLVWPPFQSEHINQGFQDNSLQDNLVNLNHPPFQATPISLARQSYFILLEGNYSGGTLRQRFTELFGEHSIEDIRNNYSIIFDMPAELVDQGLINMLTRAPSYIPWAGLEHYGFDMEILEMHGFSPESQIEHIHEFLSQNEALAEGMFSHTTSDGSLGNIAIVNSMDYHAFELHLHDSNINEFDLPDIESLIGEMASPLDHFIAPQLELRGEYSENAFEYGIIYFQGEDISAFELQSGQIPELDAHNSHLFDLHLQSYYLPTIDFQPDTTFDLQSQEVGILAANNNDVSVTLISTTTTSMTLALFYNPRHFNVNNRLQIHDFTIPDPNFNGVWVPILGQILNRPLAQSGTVTIHNLTPGATYLVNAATWDQTRGVIVSHEIRVTLPGARTPSLTVSNVTQTSFTINAVFPVESNFGNILEWNDGTRWIDATGRGRNALSGSYTITGLNPGTTYQIFLTYWNRHNNTQGTSIIIPVTTAMPPESHVRSQTTNLAFYFEQMDINRFAGNNYIIWQNRMQTTYSDLRSLTGWDSEFLGERTGIRSSRYLVPQGAWAVSGNPILVARRGVPELIRQINQRGDWSFGVMHELSHNFDSPRWNFDPEFFANLKMAYVVDRNNATVFAGYTDFYTGLAQLRQYYRTDANPRGQGLSHTAAMAQGVYHHDALTYTFLRMQQSIGWEPFRQTFRYFHNLPLYQVPTSNLDKLNLFLSKLSDFSGQDVFAMFTARERQIYEAHFGGQIRRGVTIYWDTQGGSATIEPWRNLTPGTRLSVLGFLRALLNPQPYPNPGTRPGYDFVGWFTTPQPGGLSSELDFWGEHGITPFADDPGEVDGDTIVSVNNQTMFARWERHMTDATINRGIFRIRNANGTFLSATGDNSFSQVASENIFLGTEIWYIAPVQGEPGFYHIESLGVRGPSQGLYRNMLTGNSPVSASTGNLSLTGFDSSRFDQQWSIHGFLNGHIIRNRQHSDMMLSAGGVGAIPSITSNMVGVLWEFHGYHRASIWGGGYHNSPQGTAVTVVLGIMPSARQSWPMSVYVAGLAWNNITDNVRVNVHEMANIYDWPSNNASLYVRVAAAELAPTLGGFVPYAGFFPLDTNRYHSGSVPEPSSVPTNSDWQAGLILMNTRVSLSLNDWQAVFIHEVGHALKLGHPYSPEFGVPQRRPISIMNEGAPSGNAYVPRRPTGYDRFNLIRQWGQ